MASYADIKRQKYEYKANKKAFKLQMKHSKLAAKASYYQAAAGTTSPVLTRSLSKDEPSSFSALATTASPYVQYKQAKYSAKYGHKYAKKQMKQNLKYAKYGGFGVSPAHASAFHQAEPPTADAEDTDMPVASHHLDNSDHSDSDSDSDSDSSDSE